LTSVTHRDGKAEKFMSNNKEMAGLLDVISTISKFLSENILADEDILPIIYVASPLNCMNGIYLTSEAIKNK